MRNYISNQKMKGNYHPITNFFSDAINIFSQWGFNIVEGPEIDIEKYNFDLLRIPPLHPARDMQDTFWIDDTHLLRTQTSNVQVRAMEQSDPPARLISPGRVYRHEATDATHLPFFHQLEGFAIDRGITIEHLMGTLTEFAKTYFDTNIKMRFRPSYFPFVEPGMEMDIYWNGRWMEILGCGMIHREVIGNMGIIDKSITGFAFGIGVERMIMAKYSISDMRKLYSNDYRLLKQIQ